jgi:hypothetical protein
MSAAIASALYAIYRQEVRSEFLHPVLGPLQSGPGRRPEVDFAVISNYPEVSCVLESKWVGTTPIRIEDVLWDLLRLELIAHKTKASAFFLLAGKRKHLKSFFESRSFQGRRTVAGKYRATILKMQPQPRLRVSGAEEERKELFRKVLAPYQNISFPSMLSTSVGRIYPKDCPMFQYQACVWHVLAPAGTPRFFPKDHRFYGNRPSIEAKDLV